jgi:predicted ferric reductase
MSWLRSLGDGFDRDVDFHYSVRSPPGAVYRDGIQAIAAHHPSLRVHLRYAGSGGPLTAGAVLRRATGTTHPSVYMCGPPRR